MTNTCGYYVHVGFHSLVENRIYKFKICFNTKYRYKYYNNKTYNYNNKDTSNKSVN